MKTSPPKISPHISYNEATKSQTAERKGINNNPDDICLSNMMLVADKVFEPLREGLCVPLGISSFYRSEALNKAIGGAKNSSHTRGEAIDIDADMFGLVTNKQIFNYIKNNLEYDQLIWEFGDDKEPNWVHVSYVRDGNRNQRLQAYKEKDWKGTLLTKYKEI